MAVSGFEVIFAPQSEFSSYPTLSHFFGSAVTNNYTRPFTVTDFSSHDELPYVAVFHS